MMQIMSVLYQIVQFNIYFCLLKSKGMTIFTTEILCLVLPLLMYRMQDKEEPVDIEMSFDLA